MRRREGTQADAVADVLREIGGYATLKQLYDRVPHKEWGTKTPFATIRRILQTDPKARFFKIRPGLWGLTELREQILSELSIDEAAPPEKVEAFDHTYYQGLVVEIGNLLGFKTFVPAQDRSKRFIGRNLSEIISLNEIYQFTYSHLVKRAETVDVIWFNSRKMPHAFWEIEYTTSFDSSLAKFADLQDFRANFYIVSDKTRYKQFERKIKRAVYDPIRGLVEFMDYETLADLHAARKGYQKLHRLLGVK